MDIAVFAADLEILLSLVRDEHISKRFGIFVDIDVELGQDAEPDVFRSDFEVLMLIVGLNYGVDEAVLGWVDISFGGDVLEGGLDDVVILDFLDFLWAGLTEKLSGICYWSIGVELISTMRCRVDRDWHLGRNQRGLPPILGFGIFNAESDVVDDVHGDFVEERSGKAGALLLHSKDEEHGRNRLAFLE